MRWNPLWPFRDEIRRAFEFMRPYGPEMIAYHAWTIGWVMGALWIDALGISPEADGAQFIALLLVACALGTLWARLIAYDRDIRAEREAEADD